MLFGRNLLQVAGYIGSDEKREPRVHACLRERNEIIDDGRDGFWRVFLAVQALVGMTRKERGSIAFLVQDEYRFLHLEGKGYFVSDAYARERCLDHHHVCLADPILELFMEGETLFLGLHAYDVLRRLDNMVGHDGRTL